MAYNGMTPSYTEDWADIEDQRWRKNAHGMGFSGQNITLVVDDAAKAAGSHRVGRWLLSGVPIRKGEDDKAYVFTAEDKEAGEKIAGFLQSAVEIQDRNGEWYDTQSRVGIQTAGEIYPAWLPVKVDEEDIPVRFGTSVL